MSKKQQEIKDETKRDVFEEDLVKVSAGQNEQNKIVLPPRRKHPHVLKSTTDEHFETN